MRLSRTFVTSLCTASTLALAATSFAQQRGNVSDDLVSPYAPSKTPPVSTQPQVIAQSAPQLLIGSADDCSLADAISGPGSFPFDNTLATTGLNGQNNTPGCTFYNLTAIKLDVWYLWTAPVTGRVEASTCGQTTVDTKLCVYDWAAIGSTCPANAVAVPVLSCNDDMNYALLQSKCIWNVTGGNQYLIQLGNFPAAAPVGGTGNLVIKYLPNAPVMPCAWDDGTSDLASRIAIGAAVPGNEVLWMTRFGLPGDITQVNSILACWGSAFNVANSTIVDGTATRVAIWDDPNDDGNPNDAMLLEEIATVVVGHDTDAYTTVPLSVPQVISGMYFVGVSIIVPNPLPVAPANFLPVPIDTDSCEPALGDTSWAALQAAPPLNMVTLSANSTPPLVVTHNAANGLGTVPTVNPVYRIRVECSPATAGSAFCFGDGTFTDHTTPCPCGNFGAAGNGCAHSFNPAGANLTATGSTVADNVVLHASGEPVSSFTLMMQHAGTGDAIFHDGVLCASNPLIRLRGRAAVAGEAFFPNSLFAQDSTTTLSIRGGVTVGSGAVRFYAGWFRNASTTFCPPATANVTNGWQITW